MSARPILREFSRVAVRSLLLLLAAAAGASAVQKGPVRQARVCYLAAGETLTAEDSAAVAWLSGNPPFVTRVSHASAGVVVPPPCDVLWVHCPDQEAYDRIRSRPELLKRLGIFVEEGGAVVATGYAAFLPSDIGLESVRPTVRFDTLQNDWLWDKKGYHSFRGHPLLHGMFGGDYVWDATADNILPLTGYFGDVWPAEGKVVAVEKSYVFLHGERKLAVEHRTPRGRLLSLGGMIHFARPNNLRANMEQFMENALLYAAGILQPGPVTYWERSEPVPVRIAVESPPLERVPLRALDPPRPADLLLTRDSASADMFGLAGRRALIMGKERGGIDEVWIHPVRVLRDYQAGLVSGDTILWLHTLTPRVDVRPESFTRTYTTDLGTITETFFPSFDRSAGAAVYASARPVRLFIRFRADLRWMWPYDAQALGTLHYGYDAGLGALHVRDRSGSFACLFGADRPPARVLAGHFGSVEWRQGSPDGTPASEHQVAFGAAYDCGGPGTEMLTFVFCGTNEGTGACERDYRAVAGDPAATHRNLAEHYRTLLGSAVAITSPDREFNTHYAWAIVGTDRFVARTPGVGTGLLAGFATTARGWNGAQKISGRPGYAWYFGRDAAWSGFAVDAYGDVATVRDQLELYQAYQDRSGKIFHELATSGVVHYDASDATPMYVMLAGHYLRASGDTAFIRACWPHVRKAMDFLFATDTDGDGLIENTDVGHGWVEPGGELFGVHSEYYLSVLWVKALEDAAVMAALAGESALQRTYLDNARRVRGILNRDFWLPETRFFSHGKKRDGSFVGEHTAFPAVGLIWGIVDRDKAPFLLREYAGSDFSTDWGIRGLSGASKFFKPRSYQEGAAWPLFTGWVSLGEYAYGNSVQGFTHLKELMLIKNRWALGFVEEVMHGAVYRPSGVCFHQCWSETNILHPVLEGMVGWHPDALSGSALLAPRFPADWDSVRVERLRVGETRLAFSMVRTPSKTVCVLKRERGPACTVRFSPEFPLGMQMTRVAVNGASVPVSADASRGLLAHPLRLEVDGPVTVEFEHSRGIAMVPVIPRPEPGDSTRWHRLLGTEWREPTLFVEVEGRGGTTGVFPIRVYGPTQPKAAGAVVRRGARAGHWDLLVAFDAPDARYTARRIAVTMR